MVLDDQAPAGPGPLPRPELVRAAYAGGAGGRASPDAVAAVEEGSGSPTTSSGGAGSSTSSSSSSSRPLPPPKPQRRPRPLGSSEGSSSSAPASPATPPADADGPTPTQQLRTSPRRTMPLSPSKRPAGLQLLGNELALEAAEEQAGLLSPFTSIMGLAVALDEEGSSNGGGSSGGSTPGEEEGPFPPLTAVSVPPSASESGPPLQDKEEEDSTLSLLDGVAQSLLASEQQLPSPTIAAAEGRSPRLSLGEDGFVTSPPTLPADHTQEWSDAPPPSPATPTLAATTTAVGRPPAGKPKRHNHLRRISLPSLSAAVGGSSSSGSSTPRSGSVSGGLSLEALRAKLSGRSAAASTSTTAGPTAEKASEESMLLIQSAQRLGLDVSGLRKALLVRVLGVEPIPTAAGASNGSGNGKTSKRHRSASLGMMPAAWLKRGRGSPTVSPATPASADAPAEEGGGASYVVVLWVLDVESGHEWRVRKTPRDLLALHAVVSALGAGGAKWAPREEDFPLLQCGKRKGDKGGGSGSGSAAPLSREKQDRLERYLRVLAAAVAVPAAPGAFEAAKTLQDFVGATERVDVLADCEARGDEAAHAARLVQLQGLELLRAGETGYMQRLERFVREASTCDVHKTELLRAYVGLLSDVAHEMVNAHGPRLKEPLQGGLLLGTGAAGEELDRFCVSALWRLLEAETFLPMRLRLYERVMLETDLAQEKALAAKCALFKSRPQSFFGIPVAHISLSSWETAVAHLRRLSGDVTTLPSDKLDVLVAAVREAHALFRREHPAAEGTNRLGADDLLPIFIYILCQCGIARLLSLKTMLAALGDPARMLAEAGYCLATLEGAIEYILSLDEDVGEI